MAEENIVTEGESTEEQEVQTVTMEQFEELNSQLASSKKMFDDLKKAQSGADSKVTELQKLLKLKEEEGKSEEQKFADRVKSIEDELQATKAEKQAAVLKGLAIQLLSEKKVTPPKYLDRLIGQDAEETESLIMGYIEERLALELSVADEFAKSNGRTVQRNKGKGEFKTLDDYSDAEIEAMSNSEFEKIQNRSKK
jgi:hypothetical protein